MELGDHDRKLTQTFAGKVVRKDLLHQIASSRGHPPSSPAQN
jgi:predicted ATP-dependent Lon-type protease